MYAYVGSRTTRERNARGEGISVYKVDQQHGMLERVQLLGELVNPSYLALNRAGNRLYTVHGDRSEVSVFGIDASSGQLSLINTHGCEGHNPVHLALDPTERFLVVSNHLSGSLAVLDIAEDGALGPVSQLLKLEGTAGPHRLEQPFSKPHFNPFDRSGKFVLVPDKGLDRVFSFRFDNGKLYPAQPQYVASREGAGPRHLALHPTAPFAYVVNELDSSVTAYHMDGQGGLAPFQVVPSIPSSFTGNSRASAIQLDGRGRYLYASNRGCDSIMVFSVDPLSGMLSALDCVPTQGRTPRFFTLTPNEKFLFALNEDSDSIISMAVCANTGTLRATGFSITARSPVCMVFRE